MDIFKNKVRVRVCGILIEKNQILLANHIGLGEEGQLWSPPGGGVEFGESLETTLKREFLEETGLKVQPVKLLFVNEYIEGYFHALEFFFHIQKLNGDVKTGTDPELEADQQMLKEVKWLGLEQIKKIPKKQLHSILRDIESLQQLTDSYDISYFGNNSVK